MNGISTIKMPARARKWILSATAALGLASPAAAEPLTLELWDFPHMPETAAWVQKAISTFEAENPGVKVRYTRLPWQDGQQKITLSVLSGEPPDVCCQVSNNISQFIAQDALEPLNDALAPELADYYPSYIDAVTFRGSIYAVPWYKACYVAALNLDVFDAFAVEPPHNGRWTWDEFLTKMKAMSQTAPAPDRRLNPTSPAPSTPVRYYGMVGNVGTGEYESYSFMYNRGGRVLQRTADGAIVSVVSQPDFIAGLKDLQSLDFEHHVAAPGIGAFTQQASWELWKDTGTVGVSFQGGWVISALRKSNEQQEQANQRLADAGRPHEAKKLFRWALAAPPSLDAATTPILASSGLGTFVVFRKKDPDRRAFAIKLAQHLVRGEGQQVLKYECVYPSRISAGNPFADDPMIGPLFEMFPQAVLSPLVPGGERIDRVLQQEIQRALLPGADGKPQSTAEEATRRGNDKINAVLERANRRFQADR